MKSYYLHNGIESSGPFTFEELKFKKVTRATPVWCEGMEDWKTIGDLPELKSLLTVMPPPLKITPAHEPKPVFTTEPKVTAENISETHHSTKKNRRIFGLKRNVFYIVSVLAVLIIATFLLGVYQDSRKAVYEEKNRQTEKENLQYQLQQKQIEEQKIQLEIQKKIDEERNKRQLKDSIDRAIIINKSKLTEATDSYENAKNELEKAYSFKFFRSESEKAEQIDNAQKNIQYWKVEIENINRTTERLKLESERLFYAKRD